MNRLSLTLIAPVVLVSTALVFGDENPAKPPTIKPSDSQPTATDQTEAKSATTSAPALATPENEASKVSLSGTLTLKEVCAEIEKQTGNKIVDFREQLRQRPTNPQCKLEIKNGPFWRAVDALLDATQMTVYHFSGKEGLAIVDRDPQELPRKGRAAYIGPLRLEVTRISSELQPGLKTPGFLRVALGVAWEPRLAPVMVEQPVNQLQALDDAGQPLQFDGREASLETAIDGGGTGADLVFQFVPPPRTVHTISSLKGTLNLYLPGPIETFQFDGLSPAQPKAREQTKDAVTVSLDRVRKNNDLWEVVTRIRFNNAGQSLDPHRNWILQNEAFLLGPDKNRVENAGFHNNQQTERELEIVYQFELPAGVEGYTFVYKTPTSIHVLPVAYELKNVPLP